MAIGGMEGRDCWAARGIDAVFGAAMVAIGLGRDAVSGVGVGWASFSMAVLEVNGKGRIYSG